jgi:hypothetical protein
MLHNFKNGSVFADKSRAISNYPQEGREDCIQTDSHDGKHQRTEGVRTHAWHGSQGLTQGPQTTKGTT